MRRRSPKEETVGNDVGGNGVRLHKNNSPLEVVQVEWKVILIRD